MSVEWNLVGLPGPYHNFAGLALGNVASRQHRFEVSRPRQAALQALDQVRLLDELGVPVAILPPHERPAAGALRQLGFSGPDHEVLSRAYREAPQWFCAVSSSSAMWTANAATVSPAADCADGRVHFTPANLVSQFHRSLETEFTAHLLQRLFPAGEWFVHHAPLPANLELRDEGAANHTRLGTEADGPGLELFVYGEDGSRGSLSTSKYLPRQSLAASRGVARLHQLREDRTVFLQQNPAAIDAGVFHNDVIAVGHGRILLHHEDAFAIGPDEAVAALSRSCPDLVSIRVSKEDLTLEEAVQTYLFNSLLLTSPSRGIVLVAPSECREHPRARALLDGLVAGESPLADWCDLPLRESMKNGGGPACLRLRVPLEERAAAEMHPGVRYQSELDAKLRAWIQNHYREELNWQELADPCLPGEIRAALDELSGILGLDPLYGFQRDGE